MKKNQTEFANHNVQIPTNEKPFLKSTFIASWDLHKIRILNVLLIYIFSSNTSIDTLKHCNHEIERIRANILLML